MLLSYYTKFFKKLPVSINNTQSVRKLKNELNKLNEFSLLMSGFEVHTLNSFGIMPGHRPTYYVLAICPAHITTRNEISDASYFGCLLFCSN